MTTYDDLTQAATALADPTTSPHDLMVIAQTYPTLWVDVARHPHAYPDLLSWLSSVGDDSVREAIASRGPSTELPSPPPPPADAQQLAGSSADIDVQEGSDSLPITTTDAAPSISEYPTQTTGNSAHKSSWISISRGKKILIGSGAGLLAVILAVVLIVNLVVIPHQRAEEAAAAEQARLEQEHQAAVDAFTKAVDSCTQANASLTDSITHAQQTATTDPSTLDDPSLIDSLNQAITTAQSVKTCVPPTMADDTATIQEQTTQITTDTTSVTTSVSTLTKADQSVTTSVQTKKDKEIAEQAALQQAASRGTVSWEDRNGYTFQATFQNLTVDVQVDTTGGKPGTVLVTATVGGPVTVTNTTPSKTAPMFAFMLIPVYDSPEYSNLFATSVSINGHEYYEGTQIVNTLAGDVEPIAIVPAISLICPTAGQSFGVSQSTQCTTNTMIVNPPNVSTYTVPDEQRDSFVTTLKSPSGWMLVSDKLNNMLSNPATCLATTGSLENLCVFGTSDSLK